MWSEDMITDQVHEDIVFTQSLTVKQKLYKLLNELYRLSTVESTDGYQLLTTLCTILRNQSTAALEHVIEDIERDMNY